MAGPWEKYQPPEISSAPVSAPEQTGPWAKYGSQAAAPGMADSATTIQEMPEDVSAYHRFVVKNFSNNPEASVKYLQERYPQYQVKYDKQQILFKKPGDSQYKVLDPNLSMGDEIMHPSEALMDLGDVAYDLPAGALSTAASGAAGLSAGAATGGSAALPAAAAAGAGTSGALELLRQKIGSALGIPQDTDWKNVGIHSAVGAVNPLVFGAAPAAQAEKYAAEKGVEGLGFGDAAKEALTNSQKGLIGRAMTPVMSAMSGIPKRTIEAAKDELPTIQNLETTKDPASALAESVQGDIGKIAQAKRDTGKAIETAIKSSDAEIPLEGAKAPYLSRINSLKNMQENGYNTPAVQDEIGALQDQYDSLFGAAGNEIDKLTPEQAFSLKQKLADAAQVAKTGSKGIGVARNAGADLSQRALEDTANDSLRAISSDIKTGVPETVPLSDNYGSVSSLLKQLGPSTKTKDRAYNFVKSLSKPNKEVAAEDLMKADETYGTDLIGKANLIDAFNTFRKERVLPLAKQELYHRAPLAALGGAEGAHLGYEHGGFGGAALGGLAGATVGGAVGSPSATRFYLENINRAENLAAPEILRQASMPAWGMMVNRKEQNP